MRLRLSALVLVLTSLTTIAASPVAAQSLFSPADAVLLANADLARVPARDRSYIRYHWLGHLPRNERPNWVRVLSYQLNSLSRNMTPTPPVAVTYTPTAQVLFLLTLTPFTVPAVLTNVGPAKDCLLWDAVLLRIDVRNYQDVRHRGFPATVWEGFKYVDPFFHVQVRKEWPGGYWSDGKYYAKGAFKTRIPAPAIWVTDTAERKAAWLALTQATYSDVPIVFGDWFFDQTAQQQGRDGHGYYDFLALGNKEKDFQKLVGADEKQVDLFGEIGAIIVKSDEVADNNRHIRRQRALGGNYWKTFDFKTSVGKQNAVRAADGLQNHADAGRQFGPLPNGLPAWWLQDGKGNRIDVPTGDVANNTRAPSPDSQTHVQWTCIVCHKKVVIPLTDYARKLGRIGRMYRSPNPDQDVRLLQLYTSDLLGAAEADVLSYDRATKAACGLATAELAALYGKSWKAYHVDEVSIERAARYWGVEVGSILRVLRRQQAIAEAEGLKNGFATDPVDPVLAAYLFDPPEGIRREQFDEVTVTFFLVYRKHGP